MTSSRAVLRPLVTTVYLPSVVFGVGQGAALPMLPLRALELGAPPALAAGIAALTGAGLVLGDLPAGRVVVRLGERRAILVGSGAGALGVLVVLLASTPAVLALGVLLSGCSMSVWTLARQRYLADAVPVAVRARAMSLFATMWRTGALVGPFVGAAVVQGVGVRGAFAVQLVTVVLSGWLMARLPDVAARPGDDPALGLGRQTVVTIAVRHRRLFATLGMATLLMGAARASRDAVVPLWGTHLGLEPAQVALVFGCAGVLEVLVSTPAGVLMDRYGRRAVATPSLALLAAAYLLLPWSSSVATLAVVALVLGLGNGLGNGVVMTLGADVTPPHGRAQFLASWRLLHDGGMFVGPLVVAVVASVSLAVASGAVGVLALAGAGLMWRHVPRYVPHPGGLPSTGRVPPAGPAPSTLHVRPTGPDPSDPVPSTPGPARTTAVEAS